VTLVAVSKTVDAAAVREAFEAGQRHFGENRVQDAAMKMAALTELRLSITWHLIGRLQSNKAGKAAGLFDLFHSVDSVDLAEQLSRRAPKPLPILLEVNVSGEPSKAGFEPARLEETLAAVRALPNMEVRGLMTMAPLNPDPETARPFFRRLRELRDRHGLTDLSMGMTDDFEVAVEEGATIVRVGRAIFQP
jgi:pyridoxal phosphate enzyme (YggS family)